MKKNCKVLSFWGSATMLLAVLSLSMQAAAQQGKLTGEVRDPHQAVVMGARVTATNLSTRKPYSVKTSAQGSYEFGALPVGEYNLTIEASGFKQTKLAGVEVKVDAETMKSVQLELAGNVESVIVNGLALDTNPKTQQQAVLLDLPEGLQGDNVVFTAKDIEAMHPASLVDVLQAFPGIDMSFQGRQHMDFGSMRGGSFQVILDGVYVAQADRILAMIPVQIVETMTIVRDSTALSIGPLLSYHTMGGSGSDVSNQGFVIIRTKRASQTEAGVVSNGSTWATAMGHGYVGSKTGNWDYRGAYTYATSAGRDNWNMGYRNGSATFHGGYSSPELTMDFLYYGNRGYRSFEYGEWLTASSYNASTKKDSCSPTATYGGICATTMNMYKNDGDLYALNIVRHWNDINRTTLQYGFSNLHINAGMSAPGSMANEQDSTSANLLLKHTILLKGNTLTVGGQYMKYIAPLGTAPTSGIANDRLDDTMVSWFVQDQYRLLNNKLTVDGGYRADKLHNGWSITNNANVDIWNPAFNTIAFGANYKFTPKFDVTGRYGYLQYLPPTNDVMPNTATTNSSALPNEAQNRGELSFNYAMNPHFKPNVVLYTYATNNYPASSTACYNPVTGKTGSSSWTDPTSGNEIDCVLPSPVKTAGTEVSFKGLLYGPFSYNAGYGYVSTDNTASNKTMSHNFVNAGLNFKQNNWFANLNLVYNGPLWSSSSPGGTYYGELANFNREDLNAGYNFKLWEKATSFTAFCRNLGNSDYATRYVTGAYRDPGRSIGVEMAVKVF